jgi:hypothetical protein
MATTTAASQSTLLWLENQSSGERLYFNLTLNTGDRAVLDFSTGKKTVISDWMGRIPNQPLSNSDTGKFHLQPKRDDAATANTLAAFITGTTTGALLLMHWDCVHHAVDGGA